MPTPYIMIKKEVDVTEIRYIHSIWLRGKDLNQRPPGYERVRCSYVNRWFDWNWFDSIEKYDI